MIGRPFINTVYKNKRNCQRYEPVQICFLYFWDIKK